MHCKSSVNRFNNLLLGGGCDVGICFICFFFKFTSKIFCTFQVKLGLG